eukprot:jgi/Mesen1/10251/ME000774S09584
MATAIQSSLAFGQAVASIAGKVALATKGTNATALTGLTCDSLQSCTRRSVSQRGKRGAIVASVSAPTSSESETMASFIEKRKQLTADQVAKKEFKLTQLETVGQQEWNEADVISVKDVADGMRCITVEAEISRELVPLEKAYTKVGQAVKVKVAGESKVVEVFASSAPHPSETNHSVLYKLKGDIPAGSTKLAQYTISVRAPLDLHVVKSSAPNLYNLKAGDKVEVGSFDDKGMDFRSILFIARFPTMLVFASGAGLPVARALIESKDVSTLYFHMREDVRLYLSAPTPSKFAYKDLLPAWGESAKSVNLRPTVDATNGEAWDGFVGSFSDLFDADDLEYDPETTAAVVIGSKAENAKVMKLLEEAGIPEKQVVRKDI